MAWGSSIAAKQGISVDPFLLFHKHMNVAQTKFPYAWEMVDALGFKFPGDAIEYIPKEGTR